MEDLLTLASRIPWWMNLILIVVSYVGLHLWHAHLADLVHLYAQPAPPPKLANPMDAVTVGVHTSIARAPVYVGAIFTEIFQYIFPAIFFLGGTVSLTRTLRTRTPRT
jgi:hypothetical protein